MDIVRRWRDQNPPGRFLAKDPATDLWREVGDEKARDKTSQALREHMRYGLVGDKGEPIGAWRDGEARTVRSMVASIGLNWKEIARAVGRDEASVKSWWQMNGNREMDSAHCDGCDPKRPCSDGANNKADKEEMSSNIDEEQVCINNVNNMHALNEHVTNQLIASSWARIPSLAFPTAVSVT